MLRTGILAPREGRVQARRRTQWTGQSPACAHVMRHRAARQRLTGFLGASCWPQSAVLTSTAASCRTAQPVRTVIAAADVRSPSLNAAAWPCRQALLLPSRRRLAAAALCASRGPVDQAPPRFARTSEASQLWLSPTIVHFGTAACGGAVPLASRAPVRLWRTR
jgi:hypothetical protein